jgi:lysophospholipase L1-like esterase
MWRFVAILALLACACGARARSCAGSQPGSQPGESAPSWPPIRLIGRFDPPVPSASGSPLRFAWSGSAFEARFTASSIAMRLRAAPLEPHTVIVDGRPVRLDEKTTAYSVHVDDGPPVIVQVSSDRERYELASALDPAVPHVVRVVREVEAFAGVHELLGLELPPGGKFLPPREPARLVEIIGDSISCGYGVLGKNEHCPFTYDTEQVSAAYGARLGEALGADVTTVCWSGRGVLRNYDGSTTGTMPELFEQTLPGEPSARWAFGARRAPDAVVINLGTNDFLGGGGPPLDLAAFEDAYVRFAGRVRAAYPGAWIFVTTSPMLKDEPSASGRGTVRDLARARLEHVVARRISDGDKRIELIPLPTEAPHWGCDGHPDAEMNARMAERILPIVRARLGVPSAP